MEVILDMFEAGIEPNSQTYICLVKALARGGKGHLAKDFIHAASREGSGRRTLPANAYEGLISGLAQCEQWQHALDAYQLMRDAGMLPSGASGGKLLRALGRGGQWESALLVYRELLRGGVTITAQGHTAVLDVLVHCGEHQRALDVFDDMQVR